MNDMKIQLNKNWSIKSNSINPLKGNVPLTVLSALLNNKIIDDPYFRNNEEKTRQYLLDDYDFENDFSLTDEQLNSNLLLFADGLMTIATIYINDVEIAKSFDMNTGLKIQIDNKLLKRNNRIKIHFQSPYKYIREYVYEKGLFETYAVTDKDSPVIRQANYMFGWDWGPSLADIGIVKDIYILSTDIGYLDSFRHKCLLTNNKAEVSLDANVALLGQGQIKANLSDGDFSQSFEMDLNKSNHFVFNIDNPKLWYPSGFGEQHLYDLSITLLNNSEIQEYHYKIGLREIKIDDSFDEYGRNFALYVNGKKIFLRGSNYIPEDNILPLCNKDRTRKLLDLAKSFNHNVVRVWGGGYYPEDYFYELCDELGLLVFQDLMFACASYDINDKHFKEIIEEETIYSLRRIRHHASLYLIAGNNEIEDGVRGHGFKPAINYIEMFHNVLKSIVEQETDFYYLTSSPTSGDPYFSMPNDTNYLDTHYWWVWGNDRDISDYLNIRPRLLSEFGIQSLPTMKTICSFTNKEDRFINSEIMCCHQKAPSHNNDKIIEYTSSLYKMADELEEQSYLSMLMQAEAIKLCVENLRGNKYRCNGAMYWQLNDCWPTESFSSIDYHFGIKALHYYSKRFYAPHLVTIKNLQTANISNDTYEDVEYLLKYSIRNFDGDVILNNESAILVKAYESKDIVLSSVTELKDNKYLYVELYKDGKQVSNNFFQLKRDKDIDYPRSHIVVEQLSANSLMISVDKFTKGIYLVADGASFDDNFFNMNAGEERILSSNSPLDLSTLKIICLNNIYKKN